MRCSSLSLTNFRNYARLDLPLRDAVVVYGDNAQGKSNLLEAIRLLSTTKSLRSTADREMLHWGVQDSDTGFARVSGQCERRSGPVRVEIVIGNGERLNARDSTRAVVKRYKVNGVPRRAIDVIGQVTVVQFSPADLDLVLGPPSERRRFLDLAIAQVDGRHVRSLSRYGKVLQQRNSLLKQMREGGGRHEHLDVWSEELVNTGAYIVARRMEMVRRLTTLVRDAHGALTDCAETLDAEYRATIDGVEGATVDAIGDVADTFRRALTASRGRDIATGQTLVGPHRDDLRLTNAGHDLLPYGSRGQQRAGALALKIAEGEYVREVTGEWPILLLDDVLSELDANRRRRVFAASHEGQQVIVTTTDLTAIDRDFLDRSQVIEIRAGTVIAREPFGADGQA